MVLNNLLGACLWWKIHKSQIGAIKTNFLGDKIPTESMHYTCIACVTIDCYENGKE